MSQQLTPVERLLALSDKHELSADKQLSVLQAIDKMTQEEFDVFIDCLDQELTPKAPAAPTPPAIAPGADNGVARMEAFFDRNLARASLKKLVPLPTDGVVFEREGYDSARLVVPKAEMATYRDILGRGLSFENKVAAHGDIVAGWYHTFADGAVAAIAIVNAAGGDGGAYVDAFLVIPDGVHPTVPNPSLKPGNDLDSDFVFSYPDGTYKVIRLVPSTV